VIVATASSAEGVTVALEGVDANATATVRYVVDVAENVTPESSLQFVGRQGDPDVAAGTFTADFAPEQVGITEDVVARFDENGDGAISTPELGVAIRVWTTGAISTAQLEAVIRAWARSDRTLPPPTVLHGIEETVIRGVDR
jgi:hypothetical protein